jgi:hypothetical protein
LDSVTCTLKACANIGKTSACKELASLSEDISQEAISKKDKGFYQIFTRTFQIQLAKIKEAADASITLHTVKTENFSLEYFVEVSLKFETQGGVLMNTRKIQLPIYFSS